MSTIKSIFKLGYVAIIVAMVAGFTGCNNSDSQGVENKAILQGIDPVSGTNDSYQVGINDTGHFVQIFSDQNWFVELDFPNPENADWATLTRDEGKGNDKVMLSYSRNSSATRDVVINIYFDKGEVSIKLRQLGTGVDGGGDDIPFTGWLELPETPENLAANCTEITHFIPDMLNMRNYTVMFDTEQMYPMWVAYPIHSDYNGNSGRTNEWAYDPNIPRDAQPNMQYGMGNGYDRGHMLPSASRYITVATNEQTFYYTNMTAQINDFNAEVWEDLEGRVRNWGGYYSYGRSDTLYVVTGAVLKRVDIDTDVVTKVNCKGKQIPVPNYYYKALLMRNSSGTGWKAIAWWYKHQATEREVIADDAITIDELEKRTGIDFFKNLADEDELQCESMEWSSSDWRL